jgi:tetratricopeptide (TPR) repeat protein
MLIREFLKRRREAESGMVAALAVLCLLLVYRLPVCGAYFRYWAGVWANPVELMLLTTETRPFQFQPKAYASVLLYSRGYIEPAAVLAQEVMQEAPWNTTARLTLAKVADYHQDYAHAEEYYRSILNTPNVSTFLKDPAMVGLAQMLANNPARRDEAAQLFREFLQSERNSHHPDAIILLAKLYKDEGNIAKARTTLQRGLSINPNEDSLKKMLDSIDRPVSDAATH